MVPGASHAISTSIRTVGLKKTAWTYALLLLISKLLEAEPDKRDGNGVIIEP
jgi:hypothetical protein